MKHQEVISQITEAWNSSQRILLTGASNFDGDALGCVFALAEFGLSQGKEMIIANEKPLSGLYHFIEHVYPVHTTIPPGKYDLIIICDTGSMEMLRWLYTKHKEVFDTTTTINIDHHCSCYGDICWTTCGYENTAATMMIATFIEHVQPGGITPNMATYFLLGLYFDTECFRNLNTSPHGLRFAAEMIEKGGDHALLIRHLYQDTPENYVRLYAEVMSNIRMVCQGEGIVAVATPEMFEKHAISPDSLGNELVNHYLRSVRANFVVLVKDNGQERKISLRSKEPEYNMRKLAEVFGGGGHEKASGAASQLPVEQIIEAIDTFDFELSTK